MKKLLRVLWRVAWRYVRKKADKELAPKPPQPDGAEFDFGAAVKEMGARAIEHKVTDLLERRI